jgi:branched-chain amino acid transport system ATP-binding protein
VLVLKDVHARYGAITALRGVSVEVQEGELVALLGVNGAGKSTTLATIAGVMRPWQGEIQFQGGSILGKTPEQIARLGIALVPEGREIFPSLTVEENLRLGAFIRKDRLEYRRNLEEVFGLFPVLEERLQHLGGTLSGGEQAGSYCARSCRPRCSCWTSLPGPGSGSGGPNLRTDRSPTPTGCDHLAGRAERRSLAGNC